MGRVYQIVDDWRWLWVKPNNNRRSPIVGAGFTNNNCRGGFYQQDLTSTNNLNKPAPTPPITYINLDFLPFSKPIGGFTFGWGPVYQIVDDWRWLWVKPAPTNNLHQPGFPAILQTYRYIYRLEWGRVYEIVDDWRWLLVKPAPTKLFLKIAWHSYLFVILFLLVLCLIQKSQHFTYVHSQQLFLFLVQPSSPGVNLQFTVNIRANRRLTPAVLFFLVIFPTTNRVQAKTPMTLFSNWYYGFYFWPNRSSG